MKPLAIKPSIILTLNPKRNKFYDICQSYLERLLALEDLGGDTDLDLLRLFGGVMEREVYLSLEKGK